MTNRRNTGLALFAALLVVSYVVPQVAQAQAPNATGTWKWEQQGFGGGRGRGQGAGGGGGAAGAPATQPGARAAPAGGAPAGGAPGGGAGRGQGGGRGGAPIALTLNLKQDADKLTGQLLGMTAFGAQESTPMDIKEGTIKDGTVSFKIVQDFNGNAFTTAYTGKLEGDTITGTRELQVPPGGFGGGGAGRGPGGGAPGAGAPATQPGARAGAPAGGAPAGGAPGGGAGRGGGGFGGPQPWIATRQK